MSELHVPPVATVEAAIRTTVARIRALKALMRVAARIAAVPEGLRGDTLNEVQGPGEIAVEIAVEKGRLSHLRQLLTAAKKFVEEG